MTNEFCILIYLPLLIVDIVLIITTLQGDLHNVTVRRSVLFYLSIFGWLICELVYFIAEDVGTIIYVYTLRVGFCAFCAVLMLLMIAGFYRIGRKNKASRYHWYHLLYLPAAVTMTMAVVPGWQHALFRKVQVIALSPLTVVQEQPTLFNRIQQTYSQLLIVGIVLLLVFSFRKLPRGYRSGSQFMFIGLVLYLICNIAEVSPFDQYVLDFILIGAAICGICYYFLTQISGRHDYLHIERREVFQYLDEGVFILDEKGIILDANVTAIRLFGLQEIRYQITVFDDLLSEMVASGNVLRWQSEDKVGEHLCFVNNKLPMFYEMQRQPIFGKAAQDGKCIILTDITNSQIFMERLVESAGEDRLTGLPNRYRYREMLREIDREEYLPISILVGDVNGLKVINDSQGHYMGDTLLEKVASTMKDACPKYGTVSRVGGDEFVMLLPNTPHSEAARIADAVANRLMADTSEPRPSLALGAATKEYPDQNINLLIQEADRKMYEDKRGSQRTR